MEILKKGREFFWIGTQNHPPQRMQTHPKIPAKYSGRVKHQVGNIRDRERERKPLVAFFYRANFYILNRE